MDKRTAAVLAQHGYDYSVVLIIAGESASDPRSVIAELEAMFADGRPVRGRVGERIRRALRARGIGGPRVELGESSVAIDAKVGS